MVSHWIQSLVHSNVPQSIRDHHCRDSVRYNGECKAEGRCDIPYIVSINRNQGWIAM